MMRSTDSHALNIETRNFSREKDRVEVTYTVNNHVLREMFLAKNKDSSCKFIVSFIGITHSKK